MDDVKLMRRAALYMSLLARGINPYTNEPLKDELFKEPKMQMCFTYVSDKLQDMAGNLDMSEKNETKREKKARFKISETNKARIWVPDISITISQLVDNINSVIDTSKMRKMSVSKIEKWLVSKGILDMEIIDNRMRRVVNERSEEYGISERKGSDGRGCVINSIVLDRVGQSFIINNLNAIAGGTGDKNAYMSNIRFEEQAEEFLKSGIRADDFQTSEEPVGIVSTAKIINQVIGKLGFTLSVSRITAWLVAQGYLSYDNGTKRTIINEKSEQIGIRTIERTKDNGESYIQVVYPPQSQKFIFENLYDIIKS